MGAISFQRPILPTWWQVGNLLVVPLEMCYTTRLIPINRLLQVYNQLLRLPQLLSIIREPQPLQPRQHAFLSKRVIIMVAEPLVVLQLNVEGLTRSKCDIIHHLADVHEVNVLLLQETHATNEEKLKIEGFETVAFTSSKHYGLATYIRDGLRAISIRKSSTDNLAEWIVSTVNGIDIVNIYKPPKVNLDIEALPYISTSSIVCGDFNSRHGSWGYPDSNQNGISRSVPPKQSAPSSICRVSKRLRN